MPLPIYLWPLPLSSSLLSPVFCPSTLRGNPPLLSVGARYEKCSGADSSCHRSPLGAETGIHTHMIREGDIGREDAAVINASWCLNLGQSPRPPGFWSPPPAHPRSVPTFWGTFPSLQGQDGFSWDQKCKGTSLEQRQPGRVSTEPGWGAVGYRDTQTGERGRQRGSHKGTET